MFDSAACYFIVCHPNTNDRVYLLRLDEKDERIVLTPYEKNIDVWRQLWRVIERRFVQFYYFSSKL